MVLTNFYQNCFFRNNICLSLPFWSHYPTLFTIFLVTTSCLIPQLCIFYSGSCSFLYLEPFYITGPGRRSLVSTLPRALVHTDSLNVLPMSKFRPSPNSSHLLWQYALSAFLMVLATLPQDTPNSPYLVTQFRPAHSKTSTPDCLWLQAAPNGGFYRVNLEGKVVLLEEKGD